MANELSYTRHLLDAENPIFNYYNEVVTDTADGLDNIGATDVSPDQQMILESGGIHVHIAHGDEAGNIRIQNNVKGPADSNIIALKCYTTESQADEIANSARMANGEASGVYHVSQGKTRRNIDDEDRVVLVAVNQDARWQRRHDSGYDSGSDNEFFTRSADRRRITFRRPISESSSSDYSESSGDDLALPTDGFSQPSLERIVSGKSNASKAFGQDHIGASNQLEPEKKNKIRRR